MARIYQNGSFGMALLLALGVVFAATASAGTGVAQCSVSQAFLSDPTIWVPPATKRNMTVLQSEYGQKIPKNYDSMGPTVHRKGVQSLVTTLYYVHTRESLPIFDKPQVDSGMLGHFFRCRGFAVQTEMDPRLIATIISAARHFQAPLTTIISGYRSPKFNDILAKKGRRVATESRHMQGQAVDFRLDTADAKELGKWLKEQFDGGVGIYASDNFVHIDVGAKRSWIGY